MPPVTGKNSFLFAPFRLFPYNRGQTGWWSLCWEAVIPHCCFRPGNAAVALATGGSLVPSGPMPSTGTPLEGFGMSGGPHCWHSLGGCSAQQRPLQNLLSLMTSSAHKKCFCRETVFTNSSVSERNNLKPYLPFLCWCLSGCVPPPLPHPFTALAKHSGFLVHFPLFPL